MAGEAPVYIAKQDVGGVPRIGLEPTPIPNFPNQVGDAIAKFGEAGQQFADKLQVATNAANATNALSTYLVNLDNAKTEAVKDPDWQNAPKTFADKASQLQSDALSNDKLGTLDPRSQATLKLHMTHASISAGDAVNKAALSKGADGWLADYTNASGVNQNDAASAGSPVARKTAIDRNTALLVTGVQAGWISQAKAAELDQHFKNGLDHAEALRLISADPRAAVPLLSDPNKLPTLTPVQRQTYIDNANQKADTDATQRARGIVAGSPETASLVSGQFVDSSHIDRVFDSRIIKAESNGQNAPPNVKGAFGPAQITPAFARDVIPTLPAEERARIGDVSKLSDQELTQRLMADPKLSTDIGRTGFRSLAVKYDGNPVLAMAAYNAGPVNADRWKAAAEKQFGPNPSPQQIMSVIDFPETQKYVTGIYKDAGARMDAFGVSPAGRYHLGISLGTELTEQATREQHVLNQIASVSAATDDVPKLVEQGIDVAPDRIASFRAAQSQAAAGGNIEAAKRLHELDFALEVKPQVDRLYRLPFATVNSLVDVAEAQQRIPGGNFGPDQVKGLEVLRKTRDAIDKGRVDNPTGLMVRAGLAQQVPLDTDADPNDPQFRAALTARGGQAAQAQRLYGGTARAFTPEEAQSLEQRYTIAAPQDQFKILQSLATTLPEAAYNDTVKTVVGDDAAALIIGRFARERPALAEEMLQGARLMKEKDVTESQKAVRPLIAEQLKGQLYPTADQQSAVVNAALYLDMARRNSRGALYNADDTTGVKQAVEDVTGPLTSRAGVQVAAPPGMRTGTFNGILDTLDKGDLDRAGGAFDRSGHEIEPKEIARGAVLRQTAPGSPRYWVGARDATARDGFQPYFTGGETPTPLIFDMKALAERADLKHRGIIETPGGETMKRAEARGRANYATQRWPD